MNTQTPFAVFAVLIKNGMIYATTRPDGKIGLPGGKVDPGETAMDAVLRESQEEGILMVIPDLPPVHSDIVDGKLVQWFIAQDGTILDQYKEKYRGITPCIIPVTELVKKSPGFGNDFLLDLI